MTQNKKVINKIVGAKVKFVFNISFSPNNIFIDHYFNEV